MHFKPNADRPWLLEVQDFEGLSGTVNLGNTSVLEVVDAEERGLPIPHSAAILKTLRARAKAEKLCAAAAVELRRIHGR